jgi:fucose permease
MVSRGFAAFVLLFMKAASILRVAVILACGASVLLILAHSSLIGGIAIFLLGITLAPVYPLLIAQSFSQVRQTSDTRWILAASGFGGSMLPWLTGGISSQLGSLRAGIVTIPVALLLMIFLLPALFRVSPRLLSEDRKA